MKKILVIEDEDCTRKLFLSCLETEGFLAIGAENGFTGIHKAQNQLPDLVICDILMPELDGYSVLTILRQNSITATIPFIFLTASMTKAELFQQAESKDETYLAKPATVDQLLEAITIQLEKRTHVQQTSQNKSENHLIDSTSAAESIFPSVKQLNKVFEFIEANYYKSITLNDVAQTVGYSPAYLTNLVGLQTGRTVSRWIIERRMAEVRSLLQHSDWSIDQIARTVGYTNIRHFFRQFRQYHGVTPQVWRREN